MPTKFERFLRSWYGLPLILLLSSTIFGLIWGFVSAYLLRNAEYPFYIILLASLVGGFWFFIFSLFSPLGAFFLPFGFIDFFIAVNITSDSRNFWYAIMFLANIPYWGFIIYTYVQRNKLKKWLLCILYLLICIIYVISLKGFIEAIDFL